MEELKKNIFYCNQAVVLHSANEFIIKAEQLIPQKDTEDNWQSEVIDSLTIVHSPFHFKRLFQAMQIQLSKYEEEWGEIKISTKAKKES